MIRLLSILSLAALLAHCAHGRATHSAPASDSEWPAYSNDAGGSHYSSLSAIDRTNVQTLQVAWTYHTGALKPETKLNRKAAFEATPIMVGGTLYLPTPFNRVVALDAVTGTEKWAFDPQVDRTRDYSEVTSRGVSVWRGGGSGSCSTRIFLGTIDARLIAIDAGNGHRCGEFGHNGEIDLASDARPAYRDDYEVTSPPAVIGDMVVVGSSIGDNPTVDTGRGIVRAFDARSGALRWSFDPLIPVGGNWRAGAGNAWSIIAADPERGLLFVPTGSPSPDYYGGFRPGDDRYANSVVALEAGSGRVVWHFQVVHHDLWDYDVASQPNLIDVHRDGRIIAAVAVTTKMGQLFILDRLTGVPLFPVSEREVPKSAIEGEDASPTQPFSSIASIAPSSLTTEDAWGATPADRDWCRDRIASLHFEGPYTPPSLKDTLVVPGNAGGVAWGGAAYDPVHRLLIANTNRLPFAVRLIPRESFESERSKARDNRLSGEFGAQRGAPFAMYREPVVSPHGLPCNPPPWGTLTAIDIDRGEAKWEVPLGELHLPRELTGSDAVVDVAGAPGFGGSLVTAGGLVFIAAAFRDDTLRAFDVTTGRILWSTKLPAGGQATPMTYRVAGRQYVVIAAGGHGKAGSTMGDSVVAWALP